jgi:peroxiredoxin (alkyl hydroperoxide reductase subunit C)
LISAIQFSEKYGEVCPVNWAKGSEGMKADHEGVADKLAANAN